MTTIDNEKLYEDEFLELMKDDYHQIVMATDIVRAIDNNEDFTRWIAFNGCAQLVTQHANSNCDLAALDRLRTARSSIKIIHTQIGAFDFLPVMRTTINCWLLLNIDWCREANKGLMIQALEVFQFLDETYAD